METKLFEIRDRGTFIPAMAIKPESRNEAERYLMARGGYGTNAWYQGGYVILIKLTGSDIQITYDPFNWGGGRTMQIAHKHIEENWDILESGDVICVQTLCGERETPKQSERLTSPF